MKPSQMAAAKEKHWGELEDGNDDPWGDHSFSSADIEELLVPQLYPPSTTSLHQPSQQLTSSFQILNGDSCKSDVTVQNTTRLLQHTRHVSHLINRAQSLSSNSSSGGAGGANGGGGDGPSSTLPPCPPLPTEIPSPRAPLAFQTLNFLAPQSTPFTAGQEGGGLQLEVQHSTVRKMLRQAVALVLVHAGFTETTETVLRTLTDLLHQFMTNFTKLHRTNVDNAMLLNNYCSFHDVLEQTMQQLQLGGLIDLHKMYKDKVQNYHNNVKSNAIQLTNHYNMLVNKQQQQNAAVAAAVPATVHHPAATVHTQQQQPPPPPWQGSTTTVFSAAGAGSINITIGAPVADNNYPNLTVSNSLDEAVEVLPRAGARTSRAGSVSSTSRPASNSANSNNIINLEQELSRHYTPINIQSGDVEGRSQNSPLSTHFTINPR